MDKYHYNHPKLKRRPFMTLNISVVGKFFENLEDLYDKNTSILYRVEEDDPNMLAMNAISQVAVFIFSKYLFKIIFL